jgi:hypothetical protein
VVAALGLTATAGPAAGAGTAPAEGAARVVLGQGLGGLPAGDRAAGALDPAAPVSVDVALSGADPARLDQAAQAVSDPASPTYRHFLAPGQFAARFGATPGTLAQVGAWLRGAGFSRVSDDPDGLLVHASGPARAAEAAFGTPLESVRLGGGGTARAESAAPSVPTALAPAVVGVSGLDTAVHPTPQVHVGRLRAAGAASGPVADAGGSGPQACAAVQSLSGPGPGGGWTMTQLAQVYQFDSLYQQGRTGAGQRIALYELATYNPSDIAAFQRCYGLSNPVQDVAVDGGGTDDPFGGNVEVTLDMEDAMAFAPAAAVSVYMGPVSGTGPIDTYARIADDDAARTVSTSWGLCEPYSDELAPHQMEANLFRQMALQGQTIMAAAGDEGSEDCLGASANPDESLQVDDPASQPLVLAVGGTTLPTFGSLNGQTVWNDCQSAPDDSCALSGGGGGGGGVSGRWNAPSWQQAGSGSTAGSCPSHTACRSLPDVTADASGDSPYLVYYSAGIPGGPTAGWLQVWGTSAAAPLLAGFLADADQGCAAGFGAVGGSLYALGRSQPGLFSDVTTGDNDLTRTNGGHYAAGPGWDAASGWGSPTGAALAAALQPAGGCPVVTSVSPRSGPVVGGTTVTVQGFDLAGATGIAFGPAGHGVVVSSSATSVTAETPRVATDVPTDVQITTPSGTSARGPGDGFTFGTPHTGAGYWEAAADGGLFAYGNAGFYGSMGGRHLNSPIVAMAATPDSKGYWMAAADGGLFAFGDAGYYGSMGGRPLNQPIVGLAATGDGRGYWLVARDGGLFAFGDARFYGSMGGRHLNQAVVGMAPALHGTGYWEVGSDGGLFAFGSAGYYGSMGAQPLNSPVVGMAPSWDGQGYWEEAADGGLFAFGDAGYYGSMGGQPLNAPVVAMVGSPNSEGYLLAATDGGLFAFGNAAFHGSAGGLPLVAPVVGLATT